MKKNKNFLLYISSITFCCLLMLFFASNKIEAANTYTCIDKETGNQCDTNSIDFYYVLESLDVDSSVTTLIIDSTYDDGIHGEANIEVLSTGFIVTDNDLTLDELVLPNNLKTISTGAFTNISSLEQITIPVTVLNFEGYIFEGGANVSNIYLNHFSSTNMNEEFLMDENVFTGANIDKIICLSHEVYDFFTKSDESVLKEAPVYTKVTYDYYSYEDESKNEIKVSRDYYIGAGKTIDWLPDDLSIEGLDFLGWYYKSGNTYTQLSNNSNVKWIKNTYKYSIYPKFELKDLTFILSSLGNDGVATTQARYDNTDNVITLSVNENDVNHILKGVNDFEYTISWYYQNESVPFSDNSKVYLSETKESGTYKCSIEYTYVYGKDGTYSGYKYSKTVDQNVNITIIPAPLYVTINDATKTYGEYLENQDISYSVAGLLGNDTLKNIIVSYPNAGNIQVGSYTNAITAEVISIYENNKEKIANYNVMYSYGDYVVEPKAITVYYNEVKTFAYGDAIIIDKVYSQEDVYGQYDVNINVEFAKEIGLNVGTYDIVGIKDADNANYKVTFDSVNTTGKIVIEAKKVNGYINLDSYVYTGKVKKIDAYYYDVNGVKINIGYEITKSGKSVSELIDSGTYEVEFSRIEDTNYDYVSVEAKYTTLTIDKATPVVSYVGYQRFTYTGEVINPLITINNNEQTPRFTCMIGNLSGDYCKNSGTYNVVTYYAESKNYLAYEVPNITIAIEKMVANISPKTFTFYYGEEVNPVEIIVINGEEVEIKYYTIANQNSNIGTYDITGAIVRNINTDSDHPNYAATLSVANCKGKIQIVRRPVSIVYYNYDNLVYDGREKKVGAYAIDNVTNQVVDSLDVEVISDEGTIKDAKTYHLRASFDETHYYAVNSSVLTFDVAKASYDLSNIKFEDAEFVLDFKQHYFYVEGELPEGVSVVYTIDGEEDNSLLFGSKKTIVAKFVGDSNNYEDIELMEATIKINMTWFYAVIASILGVITLGICLTLVYFEYRRAHPKKIKLKIKNVIKEDLEAKRVATSVKEVLGDEKVEVEAVENEDDIIENAASERTFIEKIYEADSDLKYYYSEVKNELLSYEGITHTVDRKFEVFYHGTRQIAKLSICNNVLKLYVNLDPAKYDKKQYNHRDMSKFECHARTPLRIDVNTTESLRHAKVFVRILRRKENLKSVTSFVRIDYEKFYTLKENFFPKMFKKVFNFNKKKK